MRKSFAVLALLLSFVSLNVSAYESQARDEELKEELFKVISKNHRSLGYNSAKKSLFGKLHLEQSTRGYFIKDLYCGKLFTQGVGPGSLPNQNELNCEHTWPQSKFTPSFSKEMQKSDLHHLFPTDSKANSTRGNYEFADVVRNENLVNCELSQSGASTTQGGHTFFEPPTFHKGNVARALFYFSVRYKMSINPSQEAFLRQWNEIDPVDQEEINRNDAIEKLQGNRNPFIDNPELINQISDF